MSSRFGAAWDPMFTAVDKTLPGLYVWRVENKRKEVGTPEFGIAAWPETGHFMNGDSFVVLSIVRKTSSYLIKHVYIWIGSKSTSDEYGVAAVKMNELGDYVDGARHHKECEGHESPAFVALFDGVGGIRIGEGDHPSGWRAPPSETSLYKIKGARNPVMLRCAVSGHSLNQGDAFILSTPTNLWLWMGKKANLKEKLKASQMAEVYRGQNAKRQFERLDGGETTPEFWAALGGETGIAEAEDDDSEVESASVRRIYRGPPSFELVAEGVAASRDKLKGKEILYVHRGEDLMLWYPKGMKGDTLGLGSAFLQAKGLPNYIAVCDAFEGILDDDIEVLFA